MKDAIRTCRFCGKKVCIITWGVYRKIVADAEAVDVVPDPNGEEFVRIDGSKIRGREADRDAGDRAGVPDPPEDLQQRGRKMKCGRCPEGRKVWRGTHRCVYCILYGIILKEEHECERTGGQRHDGYAGDGAGIGEETELQKDGCGTA